MAERMYLGVDLNVNYAELIRNETDPEEQRRLMTERQFKLGCFIREKEYNVGMVVVDRSMKGWRLEEIEGNRIEDMKYLVKDQDGKTETIAPIDVVDFVEVEFSSKILALQYAICAAVGIKEEPPAIKRPYWFDLVDAVRMKEEEV